MRSLPQNPPRTSFDAAPLDAGEIVFAGPQWPVAGRFLPLRALPPLVLDADTNTAHAQATAFLKAAEAEAQRLAPDEWLALLLGYEAAVALDPRWARHPHQPAFGPDAMAWVIQKAADEPPPSHDVTLALCLRDGEEPAHLERVETCREELRAGTLYQANLAHALRVSPQSRADAAAFFAAKTRSNPPNYAVRWEHAAGSLVSLSPECLVTFDLARDAERPREIRAFPIKGTVPRGPSQELDRQALEELATSAKDGAEHVMIVDLLRHDLGLIAKPATVTVEHFARALSLQHVHHLESVIHAALRSEVDLAAILRATTPGGSITGAPKSAAVDVIHALESGPRGPYTGTIGVIDAAGRGTFNLLIRTWIRPEAGEGALHVGGGIVVDSDPAAEFAETLAKARAFGSVEI